MEVYKVKHFFEVIYILIALIEFIYMLITAKRKEHIAKILATIFGVAVCIICSQILVLFTNNINIMSVLYSVYFSGITWLTYCLVYYTKEFVGNILYRNKALAAVMLIVVIADTISMMLNPILKHVVTYTPFGKNNMYVSFSYTGFYLVHQIVCYLLFAFSMINLVIKMTKVPKVYRSRYRFVCGSLTATVIANAVFKFLKFSIDLSILSYVVVAILLFYYTFFFDVKMMSKRVSIAVIKELENPVAVFDKEGNYLAATHSGVRQLKGIKETKRIEEFCTKWNICKEEELQQEFTKKVEINNNNTKTIYKCSYRKVFDTRGRYIGCFIQFDDVSKETRAYEELEYLASHDSLTGLYNSLTFSKKVQEILDKYPEEEFDIVCSNINQFKLINDLFGYRVGNEILVKMGNLIKADECERIIGCRRESDKFAMLCPRNYYSHDDLINASKLQIKLNHIEVGIVNYFGVYHITDRNLSVSKMCDRAYMAIETIKGNYTQHYSNYDDGLRSRRIREQKLKEEMLLAIEKKQFCIYLQPQYDYSDGSIIGAEALVRWIHPEEGIISPAEFIPLFERDGLITNLDLCVWEQVCETLSRWKQQGYKKIPISVNISTKDFYYIDLYQTFQELLLKYDLSSDVLRLEITESAFVMNANEQLKKINQLQNAGFLIEMDDFGSGYSSLNTLKDIPVDIIKMDMVFLEKTENQSRSRKIMKMVSDLARSLNVSMIAEGVETKEQAEFLNQIGCNLIQGYYFAKPMPVEQFEECLM